MINLGVVVIGRNEGERLENCILSLAQFELKIVYVDSNSTDNSVEFVRSRGFDVLELDMSLPFSAARARNEGYQYLLEKYPETEYVQFVDGDCEVNDQWLGIALDHLQLNAELASVCGRRKERYPDRTIFNRLCDIEWNSPVGMAKSTGGDFMCRVQALLDVNGFAPQVIAGEEPEMCFRMRQKGWKIERLDHDMTLHDANIIRVSQWWKRAERSGHAYAQGFSMHGSSAERYCFKDLMRILLWALCIPLLLLVLLCVLGPLSLLLLFVYPLKVMQIFIKQVKDMGNGVAFAYATSLVVGKFAQFKGVCSFLAKYVSGKSFNIIEYKS